MILMPERPNVPSTQSAVTRLRPRYEDLCQDGRANLLYLPHLAGSGLWEALYLHHPFFPAIRETSIVPILSRMKIRLAGGRFSTEERVDAAGTFRMAHLLEADGQPRIVMQSWLSASGIEAPSDLPTRMLGEAYFEQIFTRITSDPAARRVTQVDWPGEPPVPPTRIPLEKPEQVLLLAPDERALEPDFQPDPVGFVVGLAHTDANQHANSMLYLRLAEEVGLRRLASLGISGVLLGTQLELWWRRPFFAGQTVYAHLRAFQPAEGPEVGGIQGVFSTESDATKALAGRPHSLFQVLYGR